jgi:hypothetical protein
MCDYSLHAVASRPAKVGDKLVSAKFSLTATRGFAAVGEPDVAVCVLPGTEIAFDSDVEFDGTFFKKKVADKLARFRTVATDHEHRHHDALEFADGQIVLLTLLYPGQHATVLQLPAVSTQKTEVQRGEDGPAPHAQDLRALID